MPTIQEVIKQQQAKLRNPDRGQAVLDATMKPTEFGKDPFFTYIADRFAEQVETDGGDIGQAFVMCMYFAFQGGMLYERGRQKVN